MCTVSWASGEAERTTSGCYARKASLGEIKRGVRPLSYDEEAEITEYVDPVHPAVLTMQDVLDEHAASAATIASAKSQISATLTAAGVPSDLPPLTGTKIA